jgi:RNA polymerase-binding protein DksA
MKPSTHLSKNDLTYLKNLLLNQKAEISSLEKKIEAQEQAEGSFSKLHPADYATDTYNQELASDLAEKEIKELQETEDALQRLESGTYGVCEDCEEPIPFKRLVAIPETRYCVECEQSQEEQQAKRGTTETGPDFGKPIIEPREKGSLAL